MPRDRNAALNAWAKRKRGAAGPAAGAATLAAVAQMSGGTRTRAGIIEAHGRVKAMKEKLSAGRAAAPLLGIGGNNTKVVGAKDSKSMPLASNAARVTPMSQRTAAVAADMARQKAERAPKAGPMAGKGTATRAAIGQKAAAKRRANKEEAEREARLGPKNGRVDSMGNDMRDPPMKGGALSENKHPAKGGQIATPNPVAGAKVVEAVRGAKTGADQGGGDLFGNRKDANATPGGDAFNAAFERENDAHFTKYDPSNVVKADKLGGGVNARWKIKYADGTRGNIKPSKGERLDIHRDENDFPPKGKAGLAEREAATHYVDKLLGLNTTAPAKMFDNVNVQGNRLGKAVVLGWQSGDLMEKRAHVGKPVDVAAVSRIQILDAVIGGQDRHQQNFVIEVVGGKAIPRPIDHGYAFGHDRDKQPVQWVDRNLQVDNRGTGKGNPDQGGRRLVARFMKVDKMDEGVRQAAVERLKKIDWDAAGAYASKKFGLSRSEASALKRRALRTLKALETDSDSIMSGSTLERFTAKNAARP